jgi:hypothetical protein
MELWISVLSHGEKEIEGLFMPAFGAVAFLLLWLPLLLSL